MRHTEPHDNGYNRVGFVIYPHALGVHQNFTWYNDGTMYASLIEENQELRDSNKYLRNKLREAYEGRNSSAYLDLRKQWRTLLIKSVDQQDEINYLTRELGKTRMRNWWKWYN